MAIFHCSIHIISRGKGKTAIAAAAYRAGCELRDEQTGRKSDYTHKTGIVHSKILLPQNAPAEFADRSALWNSVQQIEKQCNSQLAREIELSLPIELSWEQNISLVCRYVQEQFVDKGMCADLGFHDKGDSNPHVHVMLTMRPLNEDGSWGQKAHKENGRKVPNVDWNDRTKAEEWRKAWAAYANSALHIAGVQTEDNVLDHRSYKRQGKEELPTIHLGVAASQMERKGISTDKGNYNRGIENFNKQLKQVKARIVKLQGWLKDAKEETPTLLYDTFSEILAHGKSDNLSAKIRNLQLAAKVLNFITEHKISDLAELKDAVGDLYGKQTAMNDKLKPIQRRIDTLDEHLRQSGNFKANRKIMAQYDRLYADYDAAKKETGLFAKSKTEKARLAVTDFYDTHRSEIEMFRTAEQYLKGVLQSRYDPKKLPPIKKWQDERTAKIVKKQAMYADYHGLKDEVKSAEAIRRYAEQVMREVEPRERKRTKTHDMSL